MLAETAVAALAGAAAATLGLGHAGWRGLLALGAAVLAGGLLCLLDGFVRGRLAEKLAGRPKAALLALLALVVLLGGYLTAALTVSAPAALAQGETLSRAVYPAPGAYTLRVEADGPVAVTVRTANAFDLMQLRTEPLETADAGGGTSFTVPEGTEIVWLDFTAENGAVTVDSASLLNETGAARRVMLRYPLLPDFAANRIQDLGANQNVALRSVYLKDGLKLFLRSPVIGRGLGSFENGMLGVQQFHYETKYAHNHYVQALCDLGLVGLILFLGVLAAAVLALWRGARAKKYAFAVPVLAACLLQMAGQATSDVIWSAGGWLVIAFPLLGLICLFFGGEKRAAKTLPETASALPAGAARTAGAEPKRAKAKPAAGKASGACETKRKLPRTLACWGVCAWIFAFGVLLAGNMIAQSRLKSGQVTFEALESGIRLDVYETNDYLLSYVISAPQSEDPAIRAQAYFYAQRLEKVPSNSIMAPLAAYYFSVGEDDRAFAVAENGIGYIQGDPEDWNSMLGVFANAAAVVNDEGFSDAGIARMEAGGEFYDRVSAFYERMCEVSRGQLDELTATPGSLLFLNRMLALREIGPTDNQARFACLSGLVFDAACAPDIGGDGVPDSVTAADGIAWTADGGFSAEAGGELTLTVCHDRLGMYAMRFTCDAPGGVTITADGADVPVTWDGNNAAAELGVGDGRAGGNIVWTLRFEEPAAVTGLRIARSD